MTSRPDARRPADAPLRQRMTRVTFDVFFFGRRASALPPRLAPPPPGALYHAFAAAPS